MAPTTRRRTLSWAPLPSPSPAVDCDPDLDDPCLTSLASLAAVPPPAAAADAAAAAAVAATTSAVVLVSGMTPDTTMSGVMQVLVKTGEVPADDAVSALDFVNGLRAKFGMQAFAAPQLPAPAPPPPPPPELPAPVLPPWELVPRARR